MKYDKFKIIKSTKPSKIVRTEINILTINNLTISSKKIDYNHWPKKFINIKTY